ncbi:hypothetical protein RFI_30835, partial [Reticulomyxa filosa]
MNHVQCEKYETYYSQLADCCVLFVNKDPMVASVILGGLLKRETNNNHINNNNNNNNNNRNNMNMNVYFWPHLSPTKQAFFLREILSIVGALVEHEKGFEYQEHRAILVKYIHICKLFFNSIHLF